MKKSPHGTPGDSSQADAMISAIRSDSSIQWRAVQDKRVLSLFKQAAERVPAYKDFLSKNGTDPARIETPGDFKNVPPTSKANYLREYPLSALCWDGDMRKPFVFSATSGSTGKPFYFPRTAELEWQYSILAQLFIEQRPVDGPTLVLVTFGMGVWIGGLFTFQAFAAASSRGKNVSILTPGVNKSEIIHALRDLAPSYSQTIIIGYPPFVKDVLDDATLEGVDLAPLNVRLMFAAESFTERFRDHLAQMTSIENIYMDTLNIYGTADIGAMAYETPTSILLRRLALETNGLRASLFGTMTKTPTLAQYNPHFTNFEAPDGEIMLTGDSAIPLIRYMVGDRGGVHDFEHARKLTLESSVDLDAAAHERSVPLYELPFVFVYERADLSTKLYGAIIYPEHVRESLQDEALQRSVTGKFAMQTLTDDQHRQYLEINVELREHGRESPGLGQAVQSKVVEGLLAHNSEYRNNHASMSERVIPKIVFWPHEDPTYFKPTIKQKWVIKN